MEVKSVVMAISVILIIFGIIGLGAGLVMWSNDRRGL